LANRLFGAIRRLRLGPAHWPYVLTFIAGGLVALAGIIALVLTFWGPDGQVITNDPGGSISYRAALVDHGPFVEIEGYCASSCTMHLANGCVHPGAVLTFHGPSDNGRPLSADSFDHWSEVMARHYPDRIEAWFMLEGRFGVYSMRGSEAIRLGAQACGAGG
jgi:hypothetical protein